MSEFMTIPVYILVAWLVIRVEWLGYLHFKNSLSSLRIIEKLGNRIAELENKQ
jgi:hypothetical protein